MQVVKIEKTELNEGIAGFYATESDRDPSEWTWNDRGNGPELVSPAETFGPFATEEEAGVFVCDYADEE